MNSNMIKRVQQMQRDMKKAEEEIANTEFTITCGPVTVTVMGNYTIKSISFEEGFMPSDKDRCRNSSSTRRNSEIYRRKNAKISSIAWWIWFLKNFYNIRKRNERDKVFRKTY